jgi:hypothetical protein
MLSNQLSDALYRDYRSTQDNEKGSAVERYALKGFPSEEVRALQNVDCNISNNVFLFIKALPLRSTLGSDPPCHAAMSHFLAIHQISKVLGTLRSVMLIILSQQLALAEGFDRSFLKILQHK